MYIKRFILKLWSTRELFIAILRKVFLCKRLIIFTVFFCNLFECKFTITLLLYPTNGTTPIYDLILFASSCKPFRTHSGLINFLDGKFTIVCRYYINIVRSMGFNQTRLEYTQCLSVEAISTSKFVSEYPLRHPVLSLEFIK